MSSTYMLVLGDRKGTQWVMNESRTAFTEDRIREVRKVERGDRFLLYASNTAFGSKVGSGLFGVATVTRTVTVLEQTFAMNFKRYAADLAFAFNELTRYGEFVPLDELVADLDLVAGNRQKWGVYLRRPVIALTAKDIGLMEAALKPKLRPAVEVLADYRS